VPQTPAVRYDPDDIWRRIQAELRQAVAADIYDIWLAPLRAVGVTEDEVVVEAPGELRDWVAERFARVLQTSAAAVLGERATVDVRSGPTVRPGPPGRRRAAAAPHGAGPGAAERADEPAPDPGLHPKFTFDQYVIGDGNRLAHAAALAVAELPGQTYNPLFVYGPPGVGKTHLLHSIGNYVRAYGGGLTVRYTTVETFTNEFIGALGSKRVDRFKSRYRHADVLLVDDVQFLASKARTEEEFFHTFNALHDAGSQLVLTSDRLPRDLDELEDRLRERFEAGLVTAIGPPDVATRMTVLRKRVQHDAIVLEDEGVLEAIAARVPSNVRALEGALIRTVAYASLTGGPLTRDLAGRVLDELYPAAAATPGAPALSVPRIQELTAEEFGLTIDELLSSSRAGRLTWPRQVAMFLARRHTAETLPAIGAHFGGRNHTTVLHACRRAAERLAADPDAAAIVRRLTERLSTAVPAAGTDRRD